MIFDLNHKIMSYYLNFFLLSLHYSCDKYKNVQGLDKII